MKKIGIIVLCVGQAYAMPNDVSRIFDKSQRRLESPPSSLRSNEKGSQNRYFSGLSSSDRFPSTSPEEAEIESDELEVMAPISSEASPAMNYSSSVPVETYQAERSSQRQSRLREYGFSGRRVFGLGFVGAGSYGIFGAEVDFGFTEEWSGGFGIGTGMAYSTWGLHARRYFHSGNLTPYFQMGYASWYMGRDPYRTEELYPIYLGEHFLQDSEGKMKVRKRVHLLYPAIGVIFQSESGLAFSAHLQYLISALNFQGALAGAFGLHFYF